MLDVGRDEEHADPSFMQSGCTELGSRCLCGPGDFLLIKVRHRSSSHQTMVETSELSSSHASRAHHFRQGMRSQAFPSSGPGPVPVDDVLRLDTDRGPLAPVGRVPRRPHERCRVHPRPRPSRHGCLSADQMVHRRPHLQAAYPGQGQSMKNYEGRN